MVQEPVPQHPVEGGFFFGSSFFVVAILLFNLAFSSLALES